LNIIVTEPTEAGDIAIDIYSKLAEDRILFIYDFIDDNLATDIVASLLLKNAESTKEKVTLLINCDGGDIRNVFMIYDIINIIKCPVETICVGSASDEAVLLLAAGKKGMRYATPTSAICPSQLMADRAYHSNLTDAKGIMDRFKRDNRNYMNALAKATGNPLATVMSDFERKKFFGAKEALSYGIIDGVVSGIRRSK
jgi:ATP-dependent Clp protease protease subunit